MLGANLNLGIMSELSLGRKHIRTDFFMHPRGVGYIPSGACGLR